MTSKETEKAAMTTLIESGVAPEQAFLAVKAEDSREPRSANMNITIRYQSLDRFSKTRQFKTLAGARKFAQKWVGQHPEISEAFRYAVSFDGVGKVTCSGCDIAELFPSNTETSEV